LFTASASLLSLSLTAPSLGQVPAKWTREVVVRSQVPASGTSQPPGFPSTFDFNREAPVFDTDGAFVIVGAFNNASGNPLAYDILRAVPGGVATLIHPMSASAGPADAIDARDGLVAIVATVPPPVGGSPRRVIRLLDASGLVVADIENGGPLGVSGGFASARLGVAGMQVAYRAITSTTAYIIEDLGLPSRQQSLVVQVGGQFASLGQAAISRDFRFAARSTEAVPPPGAPIPVLNAWTPSGANTQVLARSAPGEELNEVSEYKGGALLHVYRANSTAPRELRLTTSGAGAVIASNASGVGRNGFENAAVLNGFGMARLFDDAGVAFVGRRVGLDAVYVSTTAHPPLRVVGDGDTLLTADGPRTLGFTGTFGRQSIGRIDSRGRLDRPCSCEIVFSAILNDASDVLVHAKPCLADYNLDGLVDPDDLADYVSDFFASAPPLRADVNCDNAIDPDDLADFIAKYFAAGCA